ncbi:LacI family DNA-binding transcriptional regulator [Poseidonocella sedimentorum]|uniref:Transcriptional regulator, LacI family n=1 Tax=Poseidonocella sedimentorum TaxID=871652 RepID=A0A1I6EHV6_9RHOB|nr:substrate-binding domain-containing protein [Poseidonocella sedimentorum]SFR17121.1 transcriptional regulator, LacI family [Poseidonocella sedimentorum]
MNLKQLSAHLGLSQTTVSRALNGYPEVNAVTRERVEQAARTFGYQPNRRARSLATGQAMAIGHVIPGRFQHELHNPIFGDFIAGAGQLYADHGYDLMLTFVGQRQELDVYRELHGRGAVDGVIVQGPRMTDERIERLTEIGMRFVVHGRSTNSSVPYSWVDMNNERAFERATEYLIGLGHRRIGLINGLETLDFAHRRRRGFCAALKTAGITPEPELMTSAEMTETYGYETTVRMLAAPKPPTAIVVSSMPAAFGVRLAIENAGLVMGRDISVVTHDDDLSYLRNDGDTPAFTATRSSAHEAGRMCAEILIAQLRSKQTEPVHKMLEAEFVIGRSTGPAPE